MFRKLPIKKDYLLIGGSLLLLLLAYRMAFSKTITAWKLNRELHSKLTVAANVSYQPAYLERKRRNLDHIIELYRTDSTELRGNLLNTVASVAEKNSVKLTEVPIQDPDFQTSDFTIERLRFEGDYFALTSTLVQLESTPNIGIIRSIYYKVTNLRLENNQDKKLTLDLLVETTK
jgi:hypothetical protein